ncbi:MAG: acetate--CoA ligase [Chromatiaceae bacterium]
MPWNPIVKRAAPPRSAPNLADYETARAGFSWQTVHRELVPDGTACINIARVAVDRHAEAQGDSTALRILGRGFEVETISYRALRDLCSRFAECLERLGVRRGEVVASLIGREPALYVAALGTLKAGAVFCPLFTAFGPEPLRQRLSIARVKVLVTTPALFRRKVTALKCELPDLQHVLLAAEDAEAIPDGCLPLKQLLEGAKMGYGTADTAPDDPALLHFTSGTTGRPKAAIQPHKAILAQYASSRLALDLRREDRFWCTADPGWVTGTVYGIIGPLSVGATLVADTQPFEPQRWYRLLEAERVSVWYTSPTAIRMLMRAGDALPRQHDLSALRFAASVGEPLNPEAVLWGRETLGLPFHDTWWQTETGAIMIANYACMDIRPGSMGRPLPGIEAGILRRIDGGIEPIAEAEQEGELALRAGWPSMFTGYLNDEERYARCFADGWYLSGDLAKRDADGYFWFIGRGDDLIKTSGHFVGPFEVESALMEHPAVAEAGVIGKPDAIAGEIVKAFVALRPGGVGNEQLRRQLLGHARRRLGPAVAPKEIEFREQLPRTRSGKIMRRLLRAQETGEAVGDISALEDTEEGK